MTFKYKVMLLWTIWSMYKVVTSSNEVVWVQRHIRDRFRVGEDGCKKDTSVCTSSASCQTGSGLCLCNEDSLNFVSHDVESSYGYGCVKDGKIPFQFGECFFVCVLYFRVQC